MGSKEISQHSLIGESERKLDCLDSSLSEFEEESLAILEQLKTMEGRVFALRDKEQEENAMM